MDIEERNEKPSNTGLILHSGGRLLPSFTGYRLVIERNAVRRLLSVSAANSGKFTCVDPVALVRNRNTLRPVSDR
jgi:hypothetical protein